MIDASAIKLGSSIDNPLRLYPNDIKIQNEIDDINQITYTGINNGAYKAGSSSDQTIYMKPFDDYFATLDIFIVII